MKRQQIYVLAGFAGAIVVLCLLSWQFLFSPLKQSIKDEMATLDAEKGKLEEAKSKAAQYERFQAEAENVRKGLNFVSDRLAPGLIYEEELRLINSLFASVGCRGYTLTFKKAETSKEYAGLSETSVEMKFDAGYHLAGLLINQMISQKRLIVPIDVKMSSKDPTGRGATMSGVLTAKFYVNTSAR